MHRGLRCIGQAISELLLRRQAVVVLPDGSGFICFAFKGKHSRTRSGLVSAHVGFTKADMQVAAFAQLCKFLVVNVVLHPVAKLLRVHQSFEPHGNVSQARHSCSKIGWGRL